MMIQAGSSFSLALKNTDSETSFQAGGPRISALCPALSNAVWMFSYAMGSAMNITIAASGVPGYYSVSEKSRREPPGDRDDFFPQLRSEDRV